MTDTPVSAEPPSFPPGAPTDEKLDLWIRQNRSAARRWWVSTIGLAIVLAIVSAVAVENAVVLNKLDERGARNRDLIVRIDQGVENTNRLLDFTDRLESPEQRAAQDKATQELLDAFALRIDCNTRTALLDAIGEVFGQEAADQYKRRVEVLCPASPPPGGTTTTTTG